MKKLFKQIKKNYIFANKLNSIAKKDYQIKPLFNSEIFQSLKNHNFSEIQNLKIDDQLRIINEDPLLFKKYQKLGPFSIYSTISNIKVRYIIAGNFIENLKTLEFHIMDMDGFCTVYLELENLVPLTYRDLNQKFIFNIPYMDFIDEELVFTNLENEYFVFDKEGEWNAETANLEALDFRTLYNEDKWIDRNLEDH